VHASATTHCWYCSSIWWRRWRRCRRRRRRRRRRREPAAIIALDDHTYDARVMSNKASFDYISSVFAACIAIFCRLVAKLGCSSRV
jgi:hypothetical protein